MALTDRATGEGNVLFEIDGIPPFRVARVTGGTERNALARFGEGNDPFEHKVRNNTETEDVTFDLVKGRWPAAERALKAWRRNVRDGIMDGARKNARRITMSEDGRTPIETISYLDCLIVSCAPSDQNARGDGVALLTVTLAPERVED